MTEKIAEESYRGIAAKWTTVGKNIRNDKVRAGMVEYVIALVVTGESLISINLERKN